MNSEPNKRQSSDNLPVYFTGLTEGVNKEQKTPLLCLLCGSSLANSAKNKDNSSKNIENSHDGCENCAKNFNNLKKALLLLSNISSPASDSSLFQSHNDYTNSPGLKRKSLLPLPIPPASTSDEANFTPKRKQPPEHKKEMNEDYMSTPNHPSPDVKRKNSFQSSLSKKPRFNNSLDHTLNNSTPDPSDKLSRSIWQLFFENKQTDEVYAKKMKLRDTLHEILLTRFPNCGLYVVGSSMTGLGGHSSDMDMCLMLTDEEIDQEREATDILRSVRALFINYAFLLDVQVIYAKVPILRFTDNVSGIEVDLNINNSVGIRNTQLLSSYARIDKRLPPLVLLAKMWARYNGINDAKNNTLSSYSLVLMVIHYLQHGCQPPVLPCLQGLQPDKYQPNSDVRKLKLIEDLPDFTSENTENLGDLFIGFLKYFSHEYDYFRSVMSVRLGGILPKETARNNTFSPKNKIAHWKWVCIEEPFELTNTACAVFKPGVFRYMKQVFGDSWQNLRNSSDLSRIMN